MNVNVETILKNRLVGTLQATLIILSFILPWAVTEDHGHATSLWSLYSLTPVTTIVTGLLILMAGLNMFMRINGYAGVKVGTALCIVTLGTMFLWATDAVERPHYGYLCTLALTAPFPALYMTNFLSRQLGSAGGWKALQGKFINSGRRRSAISSDTMA